MTNKEKVMAEIKSVRTGDNKPWIFDADGNVMHNIAVVDIIPIIEGLDVCESERKIAEIKHHFDDDNWEDFPTVDEGNTYNSNGAISNDINWQTINIRGAYYTRLMFHLIGDIRGNYTDYLYYKGCSQYEWMYEVDEMAIEQYKILEYENYRFTIFPNVFCEEYSVYMKNVETKDEVEFYDFETEITEEILKEWINENK